ncbi:MAG: prepilin peptidase [Caulobacterales bacterium]
MTPELAKTSVLLVYAALVIIAALKDLSTFTIPNWISAALAIAFVPAALIIGLTHGASGLSLAMSIGLNLALGLGVLVLAAGMFALGWVGGGDAKLMAASALWIGLPGLAPFALYTGLAGGALALGLLALRSAWLRPLAAAGPAWTRRLATPGEAAPYGVAIAFGALAAFAAHPMI